MRNLFQTFRPFLTVPMAGVLVLGASSLALSQTNHDAMKSQGSMMSSTHMKHGAKHDSMAKGAMMKHGAMKSDAMSSSTH